MIISRTPFRVSFLGGGSDLESYYKYHGGSVISTTINKYIYQTFHKYFHDSLLIKYSSTEKVDKIENIKHPIIKNVFERFNISNADYTSISDIPSGTGMGSSSSFTVGLIKLCSTIANQHLSKEDIARLACEIEIDDLKEPIGKQDQYAASFGGLNHISFLESGEVIVEPLNLPLHDIIKLQSNLHLCYTGITRPASKILTEQRSDMKFESKRRLIDEMVTLAGELKSELLAGRINQLGPLLHEGWKIKSSINDNISNKNISDLYNFGLANGATGGKLLGAGAGGFILFYVPDEHSTQFRSSFQNIKQIRFKIEFSGSQIIYCDENYN